MSVDWFRWWHGSVSDPKFGAICVRAKCSLPEVLSVWVALLECASQAASRGDISDCPHDEIAWTLRIDVDLVKTICEAMEARGLVSQGRIVSWERRQPVREDAVEEGSKTSTERSREHRERKKTDATQCNADATQCNADATPQIREDKDKEVNQHPPTPSAIPVAIKTESTSPVGAAGGGSGFAEFWLSYPKKVGKAEAERKWKNLKPDAGAVLSAVKRQSASEQWRRDGGQYIPNPATWLHQRRWEDEPVQPPANSPSASADRASRYGGVDPFAGAI